jgi:MoxR-like ATPase
MVLGAKSRALLSGRNLATVEDVRAVVFPVLRHRVLVSYRAEAEGISVEQVITRLLEHVPLPKPA